MDYNGELVLSNRSRDDRSLRVSNYFIYINYDRSTQGNPQRVENDGDFRLDGYNNDDTNSILIEKIRNIIAHETPTDVVY